MTIEYRNILHTELQCGKCKKKKKKKKLSKRQNYRCENVTLSTQRMKKKRSSMLSYAALPSINFAKMYVHYVLYSFFTCNIYVYMSQLRVIIYSSSREHGSPSDGFFFPSSIYFFFSFSFTEILRLAFNTLCSQVIILYAILLY